MSSSEMKNFFKGVNHCETMSYVMFAESGTKKFFCDMFKIGSNTRGSPFFWLPVALNCWESLVYRARYKVVDIVYTLVMEKKPSVSPDNASKLATGQPHGGAEKKRYDFANNSVEKQRELGKKGAKVMLQRKAEKELLQKATDYFSTHETITQTGLALALGFNCRQDFIQALNNPENPMQTTLKKVFAKIEEHYEELIEKGRNPVAIIFALKNMGWADSQTVRAETKADVSVVVESALAETIKKISDKVLDGTSQA